MKREIKFRAWDKKEHRMFRVQKILFGAAGEGAFSIDGIAFDPTKIKTMNWCPENDCEQNSAEHCELMQFTGLLDKNGKEIYESDYLKFPYSTKASGWDQEYQGKTMLIIYQQGAFWTRPVDFEDDRFYGLLMHASGMEITGNIYENPDLL